MQAWDLNGPAPEEIGKGYDLVMACNTLHTGADIAGEPPPPLLVLHSHATADDYRALLHPQWHCHSSVQPCWTRQSSCLAVP